MKDLRFSPFQREQLAALDVSESIIDSLERRALPVIAQEANPLTVTEVRDKLDAVFKHTAQLATALERLEATRGGRTAAVMLDEGHHRQLADAHFSDPTAALSKLLDPDEFIGEVRRFSNIATEALDKLKGKQSRRRIASPYPIYWIDQVLMTEWVQQCEQGSGPMDPYPFPISRSNPFKQIASICYEAAGHPTTDPDRAIRAQLVADKGRNEWLESLVEDGPDMSSVADDGDLTVVPIGMTDANSSDADGDGR